ncbi:MAG: fructose-1,6-bisphosphatase [Selenomonadaceae bacterium]|nr:fructose-1,6-bisphosphatase [Selenomonadaceae bacterium]
MVNDYNFAASLMRILSEKYPTKESIYEKLIYLQSRLSLPKGTEHFMSDLHGEYDLFLHIINNCSGVIREKVDNVFGDYMGEEEIAEFCTLIYYPKEKIEQIKNQGRDTPAWYRKNLARLLKIAKHMSYKYPSFKMRDLIPNRYETVILELLNTHPESDEAQETYYNKLLNSIVEIKSGEDFIYAFTALIKRLAIHRLHLVGDFFDRGDRPDAILNLLIDYPETVDIQWGNHDVLWMGAALGSEVCVAAVVRNSMHYNNTEVLERGYGISLRPLTVFASNIYPDEDSLRAAELATMMIMFKLEGQLIRRNPDFKMNNRLLLDKINLGEDGKPVSVSIGDKVCNLTRNDFPTIDFGNDRYELTEEERKIISDLRKNFAESFNLQKHVDYLYKKGGVYTCHNGNLLFHANVPLEEDGSFKKISFEGGTYSGKNYFDYVDHRARRAYYERRQEDLDFMYFLWCGYLAPTAGREFHTFERAFTDDKEVWQEPADAYYNLIDDVEICDKILEEFGLNSASGHIINGHVPVRVRRGESPIKAGGKAIVIDGGFSTPYHQKTGISGYTLVFNSRGLRLLRHQKIADIKTALAENKDIESVVENVEILPHRITIGDTDHGQGIRDEIIGLHKLLQEYRNGTIQPKA